MTKKSYRFSTRLYEVAHSEMLDIQKTVSEKLGCKVPKSLILDALFTSKEINAEQRNTRVLMVINAVIKSREHNGNISAHRKLP